MKKLRFWTGAAVGALIQYFYDPKAGSTRRAVLRERITDRFLDARGGLNRQAVGRPDHMRPHLRPLRMARSANRNL